MKGEIDNNNKKQRKNIKKKRHESKVREGTEDDGINYEEG